MKKTIIILAIFLIVVAAVFLLVNRPEVEETTLPSQIENGDEAVVSETVIYSDEGFHPAIVTVLEGETVRFYNDSSRNMWVASNPHPTHTIYPEFDQSTAVDSGGSFDFTFNRIGTWEYHNHTFSLHGGVIIVE